MIPFAIVVLPLPKSPDKSTSTGARRRGASCRPMSRVSSGEEETTSVDDNVPLSQKPGIRLRERLDNVRSHQQGLATPHRCRIHGETKQVYPQADYTFPVRR